MKYMYILITGLIYTTYTPMIGMEPFENGTNPKPSFRVSRLATEKAQQFITQLEQQSPAHPAKPLAPKPEHTFATAANNIPERPSTPPLQKTRPFQGFKTDHTN